MTKAIYAGSFDPFTNGHLDIVNRASKMFDEVIVALGTNTSKTSLFTADEKAEVIGQVLAEQSRQNVKVIQFTNALIVDLAKELDAQVLIRGLRSFTDMEYEMNIASMNKTQAPEVETVFLMADEKYRFVSSTLIKEVAQFDGDISGLVPEIIKDRILEKYNKN